jgi:hypothetical protein
MAREPMRKWTAYVKMKGKEAEHLGIVEASNLRAAYLAAIKKFDLSIERLNRLFVKAENR